MEPGTGLTILGTAIGSAKLIEKILGPTAEYLGDGIRDWTEKRIRNVSQIFSKAKEKMGARLDAPGKVSPRVLKGILDEGSYIEDEVSAEYFSGVLASSKTDRVQDDRGANLIKLLSGLSTYQIRTHYILYTTLRKTFQPYGSVISPGTDRNIMQIYVSTPDYYTAMDFQSDFSQDDQKITILAHAINGLKRMDLIGTYSYGKKDLIIADMVPQHTALRDRMADHGIAFQPTPSGMELYLWAHGYGESSHFRFLDEQMSFKLFDSVKIPTKAIILNMVEINSRINFPMK